jgi:arylformamidase
MSAHTGTHMDAPLHFINNGKAINQVPSDVFIGECTVVDLRSTDALMMGKDIASRYQGIRRLLIRTNHSFSGGSQIYEPHDRLMTPTAASLLLDSGLVLLGTDRLSVDDSMGNDFSLHRQILKADCVILEGLLLKDIEPKRYFLCAPPLLMPGREASPIRALLMEMDQ